MIKYIIGAIICGLIAILGVIAIAFGLFSLWCCFKVGADSEKETYFLNIKASKVDDKTKERIRALRKQNEKNLDLNVNK